MSQEIRKFEFTIPIGTSKFHPLVQEINMPPRLVRSIHVRVPPGPAGNMGFRIGASNTQIIPYNDEEWIISDDESFIFDLDKTIESGSWEVTGYNDGEYDHTIYITFYLDPVTKDTKEENKLLKLEGSFT